MKNRYNSLIEASVPLLEGIIPPAETFKKKDLKKSHARKCTKCGKLHDTTIQDTVTGERIKDLDKCRECLIEYFFNNKKD